MFDFYYAPDTCALATHIVLIETAAEHRLHRIDFSTKQQASDGYLAINPKGRVPALVTPEGVLTETPAMLIYLAQMFPEAGLVPHDPFAFAEVQAFNSYICSTLHVAHAHRMRGHRWADEPEAHAAMQRKVPDAVGACYRYIEDHAFTGPYVMGNAFTVADPYLFTLAQWMESDGVDPATYPRLADHRDRMSRRASVIAALAAEGLV